MRKIFAFMVLHLATELVSITCAGGEITAIGLILAIKIQVATNALALRLPHIVKGRHCLRNQPTFLEFEVPDWKIHKVSKRIEIGPSSIA